MLEHSIDRTPSSAFGARISRRQIVAGSANIIAAATLGHRVVMAGTAADRRTGMARAAGGVACVASASALGTDLPCQSARGCIFSASCRAAQLAG